jgi:hypothetical protein
MYVCVCVYCVCVNMGSIPERGNKFSRPRGIRTGLGAQTAHLAVFSAVEGLSELNHFRLVLSLKMRRSIPPFVHAPLWRGA